MAHTAKTRRIERTRPGSMPDDEARVFGDIVRNVGPLPEYVRRVEYRLGEDSTGAPAVWIAIKVEDDLNPSDEKLDAVRRIGDRLRAAVYRSDSDRWPYVVVEAE